MKVKGAYPVMTDRIFPKSMEVLFFNDRIMRDKLPKDMYKALKKTIENGTHLELDVANSVAVAMKEWAIEMVLSIMSLVPAYDKCNSWRNTTASFQCAMDR